MPLGRVVPISNVDGDGPTRSPTGLAAQVPFHASGSVEVLSRRFVERGSLLIPNSSSDVVLDFHGVARIRLIDASQFDVNAVERQLGLAKSPSDQDCDVQDCEIVVRHHATSPEPPPSSWIVGAESAVSSDALYVRDRQRDGWARLAGGSPGTVVIDRVRESGPVLHLTQLLAETAKAKGIVPIHASGFVWRDKGILVMGWSKGGKTEIVLPFMENGATFVGDEWMFVSNGRMVGLQEPIRIWDWHLNDLRQLRSRLPQRSIRRLRLLEHGEAFVRRLSRTPFTPTDQLRRIGDLVNRQRYVQVPPGLMWGERTAQNVAIDHLVLTVSSPSDKVRLESIDADRLAEHMAMSNVEEMRPLTLRSSEMRFAYPNHVGMTNVDCDRETDRLKQAFAGLPATLVLHPYPAPTRDLFSSLEAHL